MTLAEALRASNLGIAYACNPDLEIWVTVEEEGFSVTVRDRKRLASSIPSTRSIHQPRLYASLLDLFAVRPHYEILIQWEPLSLLQPQTPTTR